MPLKSYFPVRDGAAGEPNPPIMSLTTRLTSVRPATDPEDYLAESLGVIFPDEMMIQHGDAADELSYQSPHLPLPLRIRLADPDDEAERRLFSHYLWNASLQLAEMVEAGCLGLELLPRALGGGRADRAAEHAFGVAHKDVLELGAGTALPSVLAALLGARRVVVTDYPAPAIMSVLRENVAHNTRSVLSPTGSVALDIHVEGHAWGELDTPFARKNKAGFDRLFACDCIWMQRQHGNLQRSIAWFLRDDGEARAFIVAGFHTGRANMAGFFAGDGLAEAGLEVERIWERDCDGAERPWEPVRTDDNARKRWLVVAVLRKLPEANGT